MTDMAPDLHGNSSGNTPEHHLKPDGNTGGCVPTHTRSSPGRCGSLGTGQGKTDSPISSSAEELAVTPVVGIADRRGQTKSSAHDIRCACGRRCVFPDAVPLGDGSYLADGFQECSHCRVLCNEDVDVGLDVLRPLIVDEILDELGHCLGKSCVPRKHGGSEVRPLATADLPIAEERRLGQLQQLERAVHRCDDLQVVIAGRLRRFCRARAGRRGAGRGGRCRLLSSGGWQRCRRGRRPGLRSAHGGAVRVAATCSQREDNHWQRTPASHVLLRSSSPLPTARVPPSGPLRSFQRRGWPPGPPVRCPPIASTRGAGERGGVESLQGRCAARTASPDVVCGERSVAKGRGGADSLHGRCTVGRPRSRCLSPTFPQGGVSPTDHRKRA